MRSTASLGRSAGNTRSATRERGDRGALREDREVGILLGEERERAHRRVGHVAHAVAVEIVGGVLAPVVAARAVVEAVVGAAHVERDRVVVVEERVAGRDVSGARGEQEQAPAVVLEADCRGVGCGSSCPGTWRSCCRPAGCRGTRRRSSRAAAGRRCAGRDCATKSLRYDLEVVREHDRAAGHVVREAVVRRAWSPGSTWCGGRSGRCRSSTVALDLRVRSRTTGRCRRRSARPRCPRITASCAYQRWMPLPSPSSSSGRDAAGEAAVLDVQPVGALRRRRRRARPRDRSRAASRRRRRMHVDAGVDGDARARRCRGRRGPRRASPGAAISSTRAGAAAVEHRARLAAQHERAIDRERAPGGCRRASTSVSPAARAASAAASAPAPARARASSAGARPRRARRASAAASEERGPRTRVRPPRALGAARLASSSSQSAIGPEQPRDAEQHACPARAGSTP